MRVVDIGFSVMKNVEAKSFGEFTTVCDILVTNDRGGFWFTQSRFADLVKEEKMVTVDGKEYSEVTLKKALQEYVGLRRAKQNR